MVCALRPPFFAGTPIGASAHFSAERMHKRDKVTRLSLASVDASSCGGCALAVAAL
jgi:hypothetical protein